jgi:hypothetical protein
VGFVVDKVALGQVLLYGSGLAMGLSPVHGVLLAVYSITKPRWSEEFHRWPMLQGVKQKKKKRKKEVKPSP